MPSKATAKAVDFSGVKDRGAHNPKRVLAGDYAATITDVNDAESKKDGSFQYVFTIKLDKFSQYSFPYYCKLQDNQLWKLRNIAVAGGLNVPKKRLKFDPNKLIGKKIGVTMDDDEYEGKEKSVVDAVFPLAELAGGPDMETDDTSPEDEEGDEGPQLASDPDEAEEFDPEDEAGSSDEAEEPKPKKKDKGEGGKKKGKKKKAKGGDEDLESLDISDV